MLTQKLQILITVFKRKTSIQVQYPQTNLFFCTHKYVTSPITIFKERIYLKIKNKGKTLQCSRVRPQHELLIHIH